MGRILEELLHFVVGFLLATLLTGDVALALGRHCELGKEVRLDTVVEELVLGLLAIAVLYVSHNGEVDVFVLHGLLDEEIALVVSVSVHEGKHALDHLKLLVLRQR